MLPRFVPARGVGSGWQVPRGRRLRRWGPLGTTAIWGALLGTGALAVIPHAVVLLLPAFAIAIGSPLAAVIAGGAYGLSRALLAVATSRRSSEPGDALTLVGPLSRALRRTAAFVAPCVGAVVALISVRRSRSISSRQRRGGCLPFGSGVAVHFGQSDGDTGAEPADAGVEQERFGK